ncbi:MAG TPA: UDP-N-acetylglucosamine 1-carboxyvinyltransferase [Cyanobacteria bacterium UBA8156]|nr:UDP-N-acetylglucosamine 1-carboxyvinyltransferase [Cyanobacteria bacterium UBA8156]
MIPILAANAAVPHSSEKFSPTAAVGSRPPIPTGTLYIQGQAQLAGTVPISGAKNSALAILAGTLLTAEPCRIRNLPRLVDVQRMVAILEAMGVQATAEPDGVTVHSADLQGGSAPYDLVSQMRASFFVIGPVLARLGYAQIPLPGGCAIGARPVDLHVKGLQALGADVAIAGGIVEARCRRRDGRLQGASIYLDYPSVGATETLMMAATLAEGETTIENAAQEPEILDLAGLCRAMGAQITGDGTKTLRIQGVPTLHGTDYEILPDRVEAGTFMAAAALCRSVLTLTPVVPQHLGAPIAKLQEIGALVDILDDRTLRVDGRGAGRPTDIETLPYPGFPTDMQAQFMALLTLSEGNSTIQETVFENRMQHVAELCRMGAHIRVKGSVAVVTGVPALSGAPVTATDLRASAALVIAGLAAHGETQMQGLHHLDRGYDRLEEKLRAVGAHLERRP